MLLSDQSVYLPNEQLVITDRVSMSTSLEVRVPILDHRVTEFSWRLPDRLKLRSGTGKWILRQILYRFVPRELVDRPKMGLSVPLATWLRGDLKPWAEDTLSGLDTRTDIFRADEVASIWSRFQGGDSSLTLPIWTILMFESWRRRWLD